MSAMGRIKEVKDPVQADRAKASRQRCTLITARPSVLPRR
jgi:hypothetical protein